MIRYKIGDILEEDAEALVNSVNCVGLMGRGIALQFKKAWPDNFRAYAAACRRHELRPGQMLVYQTRGLTNPRYIINFPTKRHWRGMSRMEDIEAGLDALATEIRQRKIRSIALPPLGSGLGGLPWSEVQQRIERALRHLSDVHVTVFQPTDASKLPRSMRRGKVPKMTPGRAALVGLMDRYLAGLLTPFLSLLEVHKLMYFMQEAGEPLRLRFVRAPYGPYAENLRHVLIETEGYYTSGYGAGGEEPAKVVELVPGAVHDAQRLLEERPKSFVRLQKVANLVEGFESPHGLELLATVHWIAKRDAPQSKDDLITKFYSWADRKRQFTAHQITLAIRVLEARGWLVTPLP